MKKAQKKPPKKCAHDDGPCDAGCYPLNCYRMFTGMPKRPPEPKAKES